MLDNQMSFSFLRMIALKCGLYSRIVQCGSRSDDRMRPITKKLRTISCICKTLCKKATSFDLLVNSCLRFTRFSDELLAHKSNFSYWDLGLLYELTRFSRHSPAYSATVPPCWSEMMQAQRQRRHPQHLHQSEDQHHTRTWRLQNDA